MDELISRQAAINTMCELMRHWFGGDPKDEIREIKRELEKLPSAQPERKKGKWRRRLVDNGFNADWHCSECGWKTSLEEHGYNFCPNCGADMREETHERL